jgi:hypothetical protein
VLSQIVASAAFTLCLSASGHRSYYNEAFD